MIRLGTYNSIEGLKFLEFFLVYLQGHGPRTAYVDCCIRDLESMGSTFMGGISITYRRKDPAY